MASTTATRGGSKSTRESRAKLSRAAVLERAMALADAEGLEALTLRRLAQELEVTPTALYWHFSDKEALLNAIGDRLWDEALADLVVRLPGGDSALTDGLEDGWDDCRVIVRVLIEVLDRHPAVAGLAPVRVLACDSGLAITERTLNCLAGQGFRPELAAEAARFALLSALMLVVSRPGHQSALSADPEADMRAKRAALLTLDPARYPAVIASADALVDCADPQTYFGRGAELILGALRSARPD